MSTPNQEQKDAISPVTDIGSFWDISTHRGYEIVKSFVNAGRDFKQQSLTMLVDKGLNLEAVLDRACNTVLKTGYVYRKFEIDISKDGYVLTESGESIVTIQLTFMNRRYRDASSNMAEELTVSIFGEPKIVDKLLPFVEQELTMQRDSKQAIIKWRFSTEDGTRETILTVNKDWTMYNEAYPWLGEDLNAYYKRYMDSNASILIAYGPRGTGKTSFIRDMLCEQNRNAIISYDSKILTSDEMFSFFVNATDFSTLVIEDADDLLTADRSENNKMIAKLLNTSDGLIKMPGKKIILSTNLENVDHIDSALTRPGRCFDMLNFRLLTDSEQHALAKAMGVETGSGTMSLAEVYTKQTHKRPPVRKIGFA